MAKKELELVDESVDVTVNKPKKGDKIKVVASFITRDLDGLKTKHVYTGEGATIAEAIEVKNNEDESEFPKGCNCLVETVVTKGDNRIEKSIAPHKARAIFEQKNVAVFDAIYRGL